MNILSINSTKECIEEIARRIRELRLQQSMSQQELAVKAGINLSTYIYFERTGKISLERLVKLLQVLGRVDDLNNLVKRPEFDLRSLIIGEPQTSFPAPISFTEETLDDLIDPKPKRKRGRRFNRGTNS